MEESAFAVVSSNKQVESTDVPQTRRKRRIKKTKGKTGLKQCKSNGRSGKSKNVSVVNGTDEDGFEDILNDEMFPTEIDPNDDEDNADFSIPKLHGSADLLHLISPQSLESFFSNFWEMDALHIERKKPDYYQDWFSTEEFNRILREEKVMFGDNVDLTTYTDGERKTHNPGGRAYPSVVWEHYNRGCSVRLLNPQTYSHSVWKHLASLQSFFGCLVGANVYLTPPRSQGFAPHWDDIEAFVLQLEGIKHWRVYTPRSENEVLPIYSSPNFTEADLPNPPVLDVMLQPGDMLYFPRGFIHQADTLQSDGHSLHITVSTYQKNTWGDLLENLLPAVLEKCRSEEVSFRRGLPVGYLNYMGIVHESSTESEDQSSNGQANSRANFIRALTQFMLKMASSDAADYAADIMGSKFVHDSLPPCLSAEEKSRTVSSENSTKKWKSAVKAAAGDCLESSSSVRLVSPDVVRLISDEEGLRLYYSADNSRLFHDVEPQYLEIESELAPAVEQLIKNYPQYTPIKIFEAENDEDKETLARALFDRGLLMIYKE